MFYQFTYLSTALKIRFVLDVFIEKCFFKTVNHVIATMTNLECIAKSRMLLTLGKSTLPVFYIIEGIF
jgi:hypothetical protein